MFKVHAYLETEMWLNRRLEHLPRVGDTLRFSGERYVRVVEVVWCLDEDSSEGTRVNLRLEAVEQ